MEIPITEIENYIGKSLGTTDWILLDQPSVDAFANVTNDFQFIHVDTKKAAETSFGGTIVHGFFLLSLLPQLALDKNVIIVKDLKMGMNYGFDKIRFMNPVRVGKRVRGHFGLMKAVERTPGNWQITYSVRMEIEDETKPALVAEWVNLMVL